MSLTTIDQGQIDKDQAEFDADMAYMRGLVDQITTAVSGPADAHDILGGFERDGRGLIEADIDIHLGADWPHDQAADMLSEWSGWPAHVFVYSGLVESTAPVAAEPRTRWFTARRAFGILAATVVLVGCGVGWSARADADPTFNVDPHIPNPVVGWCPGGGDGGVGMGFCDGKPYADNTKWHFARGFIPFKGWTSKMDCVINTGELLQPLAGPGGCGGAV